MIYLLITILITTNIYCEKVTVPKGLAKKIAKDDVLRDLFYVHLDRERRKVEKNRMLLKYLEKDLVSIIDSGMIEDETCVREGISVLRTVNYVYDWVFKQLTVMEDKEMRLAILDDLQRVRYLNKLFSNTYLNIEECRLRSGKRKIENKELIKDIMEAKVDRIKDRLSIEEEFKASMSPFR
jgi:hypothetical protein